MKVEIGDKKVRFSQVLVGKCFRTQDGIVMMRIKQRDGDKSDAINLSNGEVIRFCNTAAHVFPLDLKAVEDTE